MSARQLPEVLVNVSRHEPSNVTAHPGYTIESVALVSFDEAAERIRRGDDKQFCTPGWQVVMRRAD